MVFKSAKSISDCISTPVPWLIQLLHTFARQGIMGDKSSSISVDNHSNNEVKLQTTSYFTYFSVKEQTFEHRKLTTRTEQDNYLYRIQKATRYVTDRNIQLNQHIQTTTTT